MDSSDEYDVSYSQRGKKRYHRHTPRQIQQLEALFKECPHPDEKQRMELSNDLGLDPRQIKFWFQNRRTQMKAQHERSDNSTLRVENDKIRCENIAMKQALKKVICPICGPSPIEDSFFDEQKLRLENARLKEELDRVSNMAAKYLGRPTTQLPPVQPIAISSLQSSLHGFGVSSLRSSQDYDLLNDGSSSIPCSFPTTVSEIEKPMMVEIATSAMKELIEMAQTNEPLWIKLGNGDREYLSTKLYDSMFPRSFNQFKKHGMRIEASRDWRQVIMDAPTLVDMFMDLGKWMDLFPTIVSKGRVLDILNTGASGSNSGALLLMCAEVQVLTPVVPTREFYFVRYCQQIEQNLWVIADVSIDLLRNNQPTSSLRPQKLPSGCLIQAMPNGFSKVIWVEHVGIDSKNPLDVPYQDIINNGEAFGAQRWLSTLQRMCQRFASFFGSSSRNLRGGIPIGEGKRNMMKLSQRMVNNFCLSLSGSNDQRWTTLSGINDCAVQVSIRRSTNPGQLNGVILNAVTSVWLPIPCEKLFNFLKDEQTRSQWDVLSRKNPMQEVACILNGPHPGNCISLLQALDVNQNNMLILQESCIDTSGSLVVYASIDAQAISMVLSGNDPSCIPLLPSGFVILPDRKASINGGSSLSNPMGSSIRSSLLTAAFQILVSSLPSAKLNLESVTTVSNLISTTVQQIKVAFSLPTD